MSSRLPMSHGPGRSDWAGRYYSCMHALIPPTTNLPRPFNLILVHTIHINSIERTPTRGGRTEANNGTHTDLLTTTTTPDGGFRSSIVDRSNPLLIRTVHSSTSFGSLALILLAFALLVTPSTPLHTPTSSLNSSCVPSGRIVPRSRRLR